MAWEHVAVVVGTYQIFLVYSLEITAWYMPVPVCMNARCLYTEHISGLVRTLIMPAGCSQSGHELNILAVTTHNVRNGISIQMRCAEFEQSDVIYHVRGMYPIGNIRRSPVRHTICAHTVRHDAMH